MRIYYWPFVEGGAKHKAFATNGLHVSFDLRYHVSAQVPPYHGQLEPIIRLVLIENPHILFHTHCPLLPFFLSCSINLGAEDD
jgi:hypothetical protein